MKPMSQQAAWAEWVEALIPGASQTLSKSAMAFPVGYPRCLAAGNGQVVWDLDGNTYTDWLCGLGTNGLGMNHPHVTRAAVEQLHEGVSFSLPTRLEAEVAEKLVELIPCAEMVRFTKTGSEACQAAVRIARLATGREVICVAGYHGWHDWYAASRPEHPGVPDAMVPLVRRFNYNDLQSLQLALSAGDVAAVMLEPVLHEPPAPYFLQDVVLAARIHGALVIFDENVTGFRVSINGAQGYYGVTPDLAIFGKAMANGFPLAAVVGSRAVMQGAWPVSGTFGGEAVSLAAALATMRVYEQTDCIPQMHAVGTRLLYDLRQGLPDFIVDGMPWKPRIRHAFPQRLAGLVLGLANRGHLIHPQGFYVSCAHSIADAEALARAAVAAANDDWTQVMPPTGITGTLRAT